MSDINKKNTTSKALITESDLVAENIRDALFFVDVEGERQFRFTKNNKSHQRLTGFAIEDITGKTPIELLRDLEIAEYVIDNYQLCVDSKDIIEYRETFELPGGKRTYITKLVPVIIEGKVKKIIGISTDITKQLNIELELRMSETKFRGFVESNKDLIFTGNMQGEVTYISPNIEEVLGYKDDEVIGKHYSQFLGKENADRIDEVLLELQRKGCYDGEVELNVTTKNGEQKWVAITISTLSFADGVEAIEKTTSVATLRDITLRKQQDERINYLSFHDELTGLYNRAFFNDQIKRLNTKRQMPISIIMADVNGLKLINDTHGHAVGDELLIMTSEILKNACRQEDIIARWGGDEFVVILPNTEASAAQKVMDRIASLQKKYYIKSLPVKVAIGLSTKVDVKTDINIVVSKAEDEMYKNKMMTSAATKMSYIKSLQDTLKEKSQETDEHLWRMTVVSYLFAKHIGLSWSELEQLLHLATLHDIGKITVPENILNKPAELSDEEWKYIKEFPSAGWRIVRTSEELAFLAEDILSHLEQWDGNGYPRGIKGKDIPYLSRVLAIVNTYVVMTGGTPWKDIQGHQVAIAEIKAQAGKQFDPDLAKVFCNMDIELVELLC